MFKNEEDFDEVKRYKEMQDRSQESDDDRFSKRDDFPAVEETKYKEVVSDKPSDKSPGPFPTSKVPKKGSGIFGAIVFLVAFAFFVGDLMLSDSNTSFSDDVTTILSEDENASGGGEFADYIKEAKDITAAEFVAEYELAKTSKIKYNRIEMNYVSGDYSKPFMVNKRYLDSEYNNDESYDCLVSEKYSSDNKIFICSLDVYKLEDINFPTDFFEAVEKNNADYDNKEINLRDYTKDNSEYMDVYYINGSFYSKEFCDLIVKWQKDKKF